MTFFILARVILSVSANVVQKRLTLEGMGVLRIWLATYVLMLAPGLLLAAMRPVALPSEFWVNVLLGGLLDAAGNLAMVAALRSTDLSVFGPLNAFRPILALVSGWLFLGETPSVAGGAGVLIIVAGAAVLLAGREGDGNRTGRDGAVWTLALRVSGLSFSAIGAVFLKRAALIGSIEVTLVAWTVCGLACLWAVSMVRGDQPLADAAAVLRAPGSRLVVHAIVFFIMQWLTIWIFQRTLLAYSFAYFQLGMVFQVLMGHFLFHEPALGRRLAGCAVMGLGSGLIAWKG